MVTTETMEEWSAQLETYRQLIENRFPELIEGQCDYRHVIYGTVGDQNRFQFALVGSKRQYGAPSFCYDIMLDKNKYKLVYNYNGHIETTNYHNLVAKRNAIISGELKLVRLPEFQCQFCISQKGYRIIAVGPGNYYSSVSSPTHDIDAFRISMFICSSYSNYIWPRDFVSGYIEREYRVDPAQLKKELIKLRRRKKTRSNKYFQHGLGFELIVEEVMDDKFTINYAWDGVKEEIQLPVTITEEELLPVLNDILNRYHMQA